MIFSTQRLLFQEITIGEEHIFKQVYSDPESARFIGDGQPITDEECSQWIQVTQNNYRTRGYGMLQIKELTTNELVGCCGIVHPGKQKAPEIKYCFLKTYWGQGFATETVKGLIRYGLHTLQLKDFVATVAPQNTQSQRVLLKCGFHQGSSIQNEDGSQTLVFFYGDSAIQLEL